MKILLGKKIVLAALVAAAALFSSCNKDDDKTAPYEGRWFSEQKAENVVVLRFDANLTKDTFAISVSNAVQGSASLVNTMNLKGDLAVSGDVMTISFTEISKLQQDGKTWITIKKGDKGFEDAAKEIAIFSKFTFKVEGYTLTLKPAIPNSNPFIFTRSGEN